MPRGHDDVEKICTRVQLKEDVIKYVCLPGADVHAHRDACPIP